MERQEKPNWPVVQFQIVLEEAVFRVVTKFDLESVVVESGE
jgi:hypothetical protein